MQFGNFVFPLRPQKLQVELGRVLRERLPDGETVTSASVQDCGHRPTTVTGEGIFTGAQAAQSFAQLALKMEQAALLVIPGVGQWQAYLSSLTYRGEPGTDSVGYAFRFVEALN